MKVMNWIFYLIIAGGLIYALWFFMDKVDFFILLSYNKFRAKMICIIGYFTRKNQNFTVICSSKKIELSDRKSLHNLASEQIL